MARTFRRQRVAHPIADLNITNLVDLAFVLLIVFMITAQVIRDEQNIAVKLPPEAKNQQDRPDPTLRVDTITIDASGAYFLNSAPTSFPQLQLELKGFASEPKAPVIRIAGDLSVNWGKVAAIFTELKKYPTLSKVDFVTEATP